MMDQLQPVWDALSAKYGWGPAVVSWVSGITLIGRVVIKPFALKLQATMTQYLADAKGNEDDFDYWHAILRSRWYRFPAFMLDMFTSVKLPTHAEFHRLVGETFANAPQPPTKL